MKLKLERAIEIIDDCMSETDKLLYPELWAAHQLSIEAIERLRNNRNTKPVINLSPLDGETEE